MRQVVFDRPFIDGVITDQPAYKLGLRNSRSAKNAVAPRGIITNRRGWTYNNDATGYTNLQAVHRNKYVLAGETRTVLHDVTANAIGIHNDSGTATAIYTLSGGTKWLPRCVYNDELIWCNQDGITPLRRYSGAAVPTTGATATTVQVTANRAVVTATSGTFGATAVPGAYIYLARASGSVNVGPIVYARIVERISSTVLTVEGIRASSTQTMETHGVYSTGMTFPCVNVYEAGTGSFDNANDEFDGTGTVWENGTWGDVSTADGDSLLAKRDATSNEVHYIATVDSSVILQLDEHTRTETDINYAILRRCPFKDAVSHKGSLMGAGVQGYPMRLFVGPPGWNLSFPPGFTVPFDPVALPTSENVNDFLLDYIDIPAAYDGDAIVAIRPSGDPLVVLKRKDAWGVYGSYPVFERTMLPNGAGAGCIDIRSAQTLSPGPVWAGEDDIYIFTGTQVEALTDGKINREWRALTQDFDFGVQDFCAIGETQGHLVVTIKTGAGATTVTKWMDLATGAWVANDVTNHAGCWYFTSKIEDEEERCLWVDRGSRVKDSSEVIEGGLAKDGDGTSPAFDVYTGEGLDGDEPIDNETRVLDVAISANLYDAGAAGSTQMSASLISAGSLYNPTAATTTLGTINSDTVDRPDRSFFDPVDVDGRTHQIRCQVNSWGTDSAATKVEIPEIVMTVRDVRSRT